MLLRIVQCIPEEPMIARKMTPLLLKAAEQFPVVGVTGPRQSGKTTLVKQVFPHYAYVTLEDLDMKAHAKNDPRKFFASFAQGKGLIIDEIQEVPELFSYLQGIVDAHQQPGFYIITGSQNFLLHEKITQTLAGRIALLTLLPLTITELQEAGQLPMSIEEVLSKGLYPRIYDQNIDRDWWFSNYITTYVERDVRQVLHIGDVVSFQKFLKLCAARTGNIVQYASLARDCDISPNTAKAWLSILESSYVLFLLQPYHSNFNKRVIKSPKLYFYDTGLVCALLGIKTSSELFVHPLRGALFETFAMSELFKGCYNKAIRPSIYFWRDVQGHEIDCLIEQSYQKLIPIEMKSGMTANNDFFKGIVEWHAITKQSPTSPTLPASYVVYAGDHNQERTDGTLLSWRKLHTILEHL